MCMTRLYSHTAVLGHVWRKGLLGRDLASEMHEPWMPLLVSQRVSLQLWLLSTDSLRFKALVYFVAMATPHGTSWLHTSVRCLSFLHCLGPPALGGVNRIDTYISVCSLALDYQPRDGVPGFEVETRDDLFWAPVANRTRKRLKALEGSHIYGDT